MIFQNLSWGMQSTTNMTRVDNLKHILNDFFQCIRNHKFYNPQKHQKIIFYNILSQYELQQDLQFDYNKKFSIVDCFCGTGKSVIELYIIYFFTVYMNKHHSLYTTITKRPILNTTKTPVVVYFTSRINLVGQFFEKYLHKLQQFIQPFAICSKTQMNNHEMHAKYEKHYSTDKNHILHKLHTQINKPIVLLSTYHSKQVVYDVIQSLDHGCFCFPTMICDEAHNIFPSSGKSIPEVINNQDSYYNFFYNHKNSISNTFDSIFFFTATPYHYATFDKQMYELFHSCSHYPYMKAVHDNQCKVIKCPVYFYSLPNNPDFHPIYHEMYKHNPLFYLSDNETIESQEEDDQESSSSINGYLENVPKETMFNYRRQSMYKKMKILCLNSLDTRSDKYLSFHRYAKKSDVQLHSYFTSVKEFVEYANSKTSNGKSIIQSIYDETYDSYMKKHPDIKSIIPHKKCMVYGIYANTHENQRKKLLKHLENVKKDELYILASCQVISEGIDTASVNCVSFFDPISSVKDIIQFIGRSTRVERNKDGVPYEKQKYANVLLFEMVEQRLIEDVDEETRQNNISKSIGNNHSTILKVFAALEQENPELFYMCLRHPFTLTNSEIDIRMKIRKLEKVNEYTDYKDIVSHAMNVTGMKNNEDNQKVHHEKLKQKGKAMKEIMNYHELSKAIQLPVRVENNDRSNNTVKIYNPNGEIEFSTEDEMYIRDTNFSLNEIIVLEKLSKPYIDPNDIHNQTVSQKTWTVYNKKIKQNNGGNKNKQPKPKLPKRKPFIVSTDTSELEIKLDVSMDYTQMDTHIQRRYIEFQVTRQLGKAFLENCELFKEYVRMYNELPKRSTVYKGRKIGVWMDTQRQNKKKGKLSEDKIQALENTPHWLWDPYDEEWNKNCELLKEYLYKYNELPKCSTVYKGRKIGVWMNTQRQNKKKGKLSQERIQALERIYGWVWDADEEWNKNCEILKEYVDNYNQLPKRSTVYKGRKIGNWMTKQRQDKKKAKLSQEKIQALENTPHWLWDPYDEEWNKNCEILKEYVDNYNELPKRSTEYKGRKIGSWMKTQRQYKKKGKLSQEKIQALERISGWTWKDPSNNIIEKTLSNRQLVSNIINDKQSMTYKALIDKYGISEVSLRKIITQGKEMENLPTPNGNIGCNGCNTGGNDTDIRNSNRNTNADTDTDSNNNSNNNSNNKNKNKNKSNHNKDEKENQHQQKNNKNTMKIQSKDKKKQENKEKNDEDDKQNGSSIQSPSSVDPKPVSKSKSKPDSKTKSLLKKPNPVIKRKENHPYHKTTPKTNSSTKNYQSGYHPTNDDMKDVMNGCIASTIYQSKDDRRSKQEGWYILLDYTDFRTATTLYHSGCVDQEIFLKNLIIPQKKYQHYVEMKKHKLFGNNVQYGDLCDIVLENVSYQKPIELLYMDFTCGASVAKGILERLYHSNHELKNTVCGITVSCRDIERSDYSGHSITRLTSYIHSKFKIRSVLYKQFDTMEDHEIFKSYGQKMLMFTSLFYIEYKK